MSPNLYFIAIALLAIVYIFSSVKKGKLTINESALWLVGSVIMLILSVFPKIIDKVSVMVGVDYPPSLFFVICIVFLLLMNLRLSKKVMAQQEKIIGLAQEVAIIKQANQGKTKK